MRGSGFTYFIKEGLANTFKNSLMSIASVGVLVACLIIMGSFILVSANINNIMSEIESQNEIVVFLNSSVTQDKLSLVKSKISAIENVRHIEFVDKNLAFENYKNNMQLQELLEGMESPISDSFHVFLKDIALMGSTITQLENIEGIEKVRGREDISRNLVTLKHILSAIMLWFFAILIVISIFIISNTIKLTMFARKREISIMKHVGATDWFIRWPFLVEGITIGLLSAGIAFGIQWYIYTYIIDNVLSGINLIRLLPFKAYAVELLLGFLAASFLISVIGSMTSIRKYLKT